MGISDRLANLHILLNAKSFQRWPLEVRFFAPDVHKMWTRLALTARLNRPDSKDLEVTLYAGDDQTEKDGISNLSQGLPIPDLPKGIDALDVTYQSMKPKLEQSIATLQPKNLRCAVCEEVADSSAVSYTHLTLPTKRIV